MAFPDCVQPSPFRSFLNGGVCAQQAVVQMVQTRFVCVYGSKFARLAWPALNGFFLHQKCIVAERSRKEPMFLLTNHFIFIMVLPFDQHKTEKLSRNQFYRNPQSVDKKKKKIIRGLYRANFYIQQQNAKFSLYANVCFMRRAFWSTMLCSQVGNRLFIFLFGGNHLQWHAIASSVKHSRSIVQ